MKTFTTARQTLVLGVCALAAIFGGAVVFGQTAGQTPSKEPRLSA
jgi:hypothetical protein